MRESIHITLKGWLTLIISLLALTDIFIIVDVPFLREIFSLLFFILVPGILVIQLLHLRLELYQKAVLSVGLSLAVILAIGFTLNSLYPFLKSPLSLLPVIITFNLVVIILTLLTYYRKQEDYKANSFQLSSNNLFKEFKQKIISKDELLSPVLFPFLLPIMAVLGTYLMNQYENNILLLLTLFLIPVYLLIIVYFREKINNKLYPLTVWLISLTLLLMAGLTSSYLTGRDIHNEFYCFKLTIYNFHWDLNTFYNAYNACLSITILPTILQVLSGIQAEYVFKLIYAIIGSLIPLSVYSIAKKYIGERYAFFAGLLFVFQLFFINILGATRQEIAVLFFFLAIMAYFEPNIKGMAKKILILIFLVGTLVSHYSTAYVTFAIILPLLAIPSLKTLIKEHRISFTNWDVILISLAMLGLWYFLYASVQFAAGSQVVGTTVSAMGQGSPTVATKGAYVLGILGIVLKSLPNTVSVIVHDIVFAIILLGFATIIYKFSHYRKIFDLEYFVAIVLSVVLLVLFVALPYVSIAYDAARLFFQLVIFLAPLFVIGCITLSKLIKRPKWDVWIAILILIVLFSCVTYLQYSFLGEPYSGIYEKDGTIRSEAFIYPSEMASAGWIKSNGYNLSIYTDGRGSQRLTDAFGVDRYNREINASYFAWNKTVNKGYIFLGRVNIEKGKIIDIYDDIVISDIRNYSHLIIGKQKIYDSGGSQIWW